MATLRNLRLKEVRYAKEVIAAENFLRECVGKRSFKGTEKRLEKAKAQLAEVRACIRDSLPPVEVEDGYLVLYRDTESSNTDMCPFCGETHCHGRGDGGRVSHCVLDFGFGKDLIELPPGVTHRGSYELKTRTITPTYTVL